MCIHFLRASSVYVLSKVARDTDKYVGEFRITKFKTRNIGTQEINTSFMLHTLDKSYTDSTKT